MQYRFIVIIAALFLKPTFTFSQCTLAINLINATIICDEETPNPDPVSLSIPYTGTDANFMTSVTVVSPPDAPTPIVGGDDPSNQPSGDIVISDMIEGGTYLISLMGQECNFGTFTYVIPDGTCGMALPVELAYFYGQPTTNRTEVSLHWATSSEIDADRYVIERSTNGGRTFLSISTLSAAGSTNERQQYNWIDKRPVQGMNYYRLVQYDLDGTFTKYGPLAIQIDGHEEELFVYPNPTNGELNIQGYENRIKQLEIWNLQGQLVRTLEVGHVDARSFLVSDLATGTYHIRALGAEGEILGSSSFHKIE
ncbi:MAG: T9SS type A sorting domain-containing protein [Bacteroidota bacterium]